MRGRSPAGAAVIAQWLLVGACLFGVVADVRRIVVAGDLAHGRAHVEDLLGADQFVSVALVVGVAAVVLALALLVRWRPAPGVAGLAVPVVVTFGAACAVQALTVDTTGQRQAHDALHLALLGLVVAAAIRALLAVSRDPGAPPAPRRRAAPADSAGVRVVSEDEARAARDAR